MVLGVIEDDHDSRTYFWGMEEVYVWFEMAW